MAAAGTVSGALNPVMRRALVEHAAVQKIKDEVVQHIVDDTVTAMKNSPNAADKNIPPERVRNIAQTYYEELERASNYAFPAGVTGAVAATFAQTAVNSYAGVDNPSRRRIVKGLATGALAVAAVQGGITAYNIADSMQIPALGSGVSASQIEEATGNTVIKLQDSASNTEIQAVVAKFEPIRRERAGEYLKQSYIKQQQEAGAKSGVNGL